MGLNSPSFPGGTAGQVGQLSDLEVDGTTVVVDEANDRVGVGTAAPVSKLDVAGKVAITTEVTTPVAPADGKGWLYTKSDGKIYWQSFDVAETDLTSGGGAGGTSILEVQVFT